ncbi:MAG: SDR family oxidoreductase [Epsilonproteobacteria bacterium]|nr:SDR family oxidoreductase [Campylobacterota bacterium]
MQKILVTGSEGYIGTVMMPMLIDNGFEVVGLDNCYYSDGNLNNTAFPQYELVHKDVRDVTIEDFKDKNYYAVVHLAALSNDPLGMLDEQLTYDINYKASVNIAKLAKEAGVERFVFASSCSLYGQGGNDALTEEDASNPQTAYGKSKILAEEGIAELADETFSPTYMRNSTAFGFSPRMRFDIVVNSLSGYAKVDKEIKILGDGKPWRPLVHVKDICGAVIHVLKADKRLIHNEAFNVGDTDENYQIRSIAEHVKKYFSDCEIKIMQDDAGDTRNYNVSFKKLNEQLGFKISHRLDNGIAALKNEYDKVALNKQFEHKDYTRLKQIQYLLNEGIVDNDLRRKK